MLWIKNCILQIKWVLHGVYDVASWGKNGTIILSWFNDHNLKHSIATFSQPDRIFTISNVFAAFSKSRRMFTVSNVFTTFSKPRRMFTVSNVLATFSKRRWIFTVWNVFGTFSKPRRKEFIRQFQSGHP